MFSLHRPPSMWKHRSPSLEQAPADPGKQASRANQSPDWPWLRRTECNGKKREEGQKGGRQGNVQ